MAKRNGAPEPQAMSVTITPDIDRGLGEFIDQFPKAIRVGDMTVMEATELRARNKVITRLTEDIDHLARARAIVANEKIAFIRSVGARVGLGPRDELTVDDETGAINHTATRRFVQPPEPEPDLAESDIAEAPPTAPVN